MGPVVAVFNNGNARKATPRPHAPKGYQIARRAGFPVAEW